MMDVHNHVRMVTVGVVHTSPHLTLPDVVLLALPAAMMAIIDMALPPRKQVTSLH